VSGPGQYRPPGRLRLLVMFLGEQVYEFLTALGWQPKEQRDEEKPPG
jgi:hypothetical protein